MIVHEGKAGGALFGQPNRVEHAVELDVESLRQHRQDGDVDGLGAEVAVADDEAAGLRRRDEIADEGAAHGIVGDGETLAAGDLLHTGLEVLLLDGNDVIGAGAPQEICLVRPCVSQAMTMAPAFFAICNPPSAALLLAAVTRTMSSDDTPAQSTSPPQAVSYWLQIAPRSTAEIPSGLRATQNAGTTALSP